MFALEVSRIAKSFGEVQAVADVSFSVQSGQIFGLLGPNGSGKTTTIRMMLDIFTPDQGTISILGGAIDEAKKERIGYMPEERGLYQEITLERCLLYLARLKGVKEKEARTLLNRYLDRFDLVDFRNKKVKTLSKGMQQKAQIINTILHRPELVIIDEPFTALDPVNMRMVKTVMRELRDEGVTIIMSTHQMRQVEELCDHIVLIDRGRDVLSGELKDIRRQFSGHALLVQTIDSLPELAGVKSVTPHNDALKLSLADETAPQDVLGALVNAGVLLDRYEIATPSLDEIFIKVVEGNGSP